MSGDILVGERFCNLVVLGIDPHSKMKEGVPLAKCYWKYLCKCDCGRTTSVNKYKLLTHHTKSCGCRRGFPSEIVNLNVIVLIKLNNKVEKFAIVDAEHLPLVEGHAWYETPRGSVESRFNGKLHKLHHVITGERFKYVDHKNGNPLDNCLVNLRECTMSQNSGNACVRKDNTSQYRGVVRRIRKERKDDWVSFLTHEGVKYYVGSGQDPKVLSDKYNKLEKELRGEFAYVNRPIWTIIKQEELQTAYKLATGGETEKAVCYVSDLLIEKKRI